MKSRRTFIAAVTALTGATVCMPKAVKARPSPGAEIAAVALSAPSAAALATAQTYRKFDPALSDAEMTTIARNIDASASAAAKLNPKNKRLRNSDDMVARFAAGPSSEGR